MTKSVKTTKQWLKSLGILDNILIELLEKLDVKFPEEDLKKYNDPKTLKKFKTDAINERNKKDTDTQGKNKFRDEKLVKLEKEWRRIANMKKKIGNKNPKKTGNKNKDTPLKSKSQEEEISKQGVKLRKWMQKEGCFATELFEELVLAGVTEQGNLNIIDSDNKMSEIRRKALVKRGNVNKDKLMKKINEFEKLWRQATGNKKSMQTGNTNKKKRPTNNDNKAPDPKLKQWLQKNEIFALDFVEALESQGITTLDDLNKIDSLKKLKKIETIAQNARNKNTKNQKQRNQIKNKIIPAFKSKLKEEYGINFESMQTENTKNSKPKKNETSIPSTEMTRWLKKNDVFMVKLAEELNRREINKPSDLTKINSEEEYFKLYKQVKLEETANQDKQKIEGVEKKFRAFEKHWREITGIKKKIGQQQNYKTN